MRFTAFKVAVILLVGIASLYADQRGGKGRSQGGRGSATTTTTTTGDSANTYYDYLRSDYASNEVSAHSFRTQSDINNNDDASCTDGTPDSPYITYSATPDMARISVPAFSPTQADVCWSVTDRVLSAAINNSQTTLTLTVEFNADQGSSLKCDNEIILVGTDNGGGSLSNLTRGYGGTAAASHAMGTVCSVSNNSIQGALVVTFTPIADGETVLYTWDEVATTSYQNSGVPGHKKYQILESSAVWIEPRWLFQGSGDSGFSATCWNSSTHFAAVDIRTYGNIYDDEPIWINGNSTRQGPNTSNDNETGNTLIPDAGMVSYCMKPGVKYRYWLRIKKRANDWEDLSWWIRGEDEGSATRIYNEVQVSIASGKTLNGFWQEGNTSSTTYYPSGHAQNPLISCFANLWVGKVSGAAASGTFSDDDMNNNHLSHAPVAAGTCS